MRDNIKEGVKGERKHVAVVFLHVLKEQRVPAADVMGQTHVNGAGGRGPADGFCFGEEFANIILLTQTLSFPYRESKVFKAQRAHVKINACFHGEFDAILSHKVQS